MARKRKKNPGTRAGPPVAVPRTSRPSPWVAKRWRLLGIAAAALVGIAVSFAAYHRDAKDSRPQPFATAATSDAVALEAAHYVGGAACAGCHDKERAAWRGSDHDLAMQVASEGSVLGNFADAKYTYGATTSTFSRRGGRFVVNTDGPDGTLADFEIKYTFGVYPLQQYLVEFPGGRLQALSVAWDSRPKAHGGQRWFHLYPGQNIKAGEWLHWTSGGQNWNFNCAECHSTNLRKNFDAATGAYTTTWAELNVSCEACHGPASRHIAWANKRGDWKALAPTKGLVLALDERKGVNWTPVPETGTARRSTPRASTRELDMCARCHGRAARISDDYAHGNAPLETHRPALLTEGLYWDDGQMREEVYNWGSFAQSKMHANGVICSDCHDPHSMKVRAQGNALCGQCHQPAKFDAPGHTHHPEGTAAAACTACHMPTRTYMEIDPRHDHSIRIPRPDLSVTLGTPNACNACHTKQSAQWAADAIAKWNGGVRMTGYQRFAAAFRAGSNGGPRARGALLELIDDKTQPAIVRASALARIGRSLAPSVVPAVASALDDPDALVRVAAVEALANTDQSVRRRYLPRILSDPVRAVRIEAARALAGQAEAGLPAAERVRFESALTQFIDVQRYNADRPEGRAALGNLYAVRGLAEEAIAEYRKAIELDSTFVPAYVNLADLYRARGVDIDAETVVRAGLLIVPNAAALHHTLGLILVRQKRSADALTELAEAARIEPDNARYAYVHAVALNDLGQPQRAVKLLEAALTRQPYDRDLLSGLAFFTAQAGRSDAALGYAGRLRELDPENPEYAQLAARIERGSIR